MRSTLILALGQQRPELHSNKSEKMNKNMTILMGGGPYETPTLSLFEIENEGILCASTQEFEDEVPWVW